MFRGFGQEVFKHSMAMSLGYDRNTHAIKDELPPQLFVTFIPNSHRTLQLNFEIYVDYDEARRNWPDLGKYRIATSEFGYGFQLCYSPIKKEKLHVRAIIGAGMRSSSSFINAETPLLKSYIQLPPELSSYYSYYSIGAMYKIKPQHGIQLDIGNGVRNLSLGYHYFFQNHENEK
jgi:hypothetical protein